MSFVQIMEALRHYGADVLLIALGVTLITSLLEKTVMKSCNKKVFAFLPFAIGIVIFVVYRMISTCLSAEELVSAVEDGFGCGCVATLYYVVYAQFLRGKFKADPLLPLLGFLPDAVRETAAKEIFEGSKEKSEEELRPYLKEALGVYCALPEEELEAQAELLAQYLLSLR